MFEALAGQLPILGARTSSCVVACYGSLEWARSLIESLPTTAEYATTRRDPLSTPEPAFDLMERQSQGIIERLRQACRGAAFNAVLVIRALDELASHKRLPNDETTIADMIRKLECAAALSDIEEKTASS
jgi:hypothetical protein